MKKEDLPPELRADLDLVHSSIPEREPGEPTELFTLRGTPAVIVLALAAVLFVLNAVHRRTHLSTAEEGAIRKALTLHYRANLYRQSDLRLAVPEERQRFLSLMESYEQVELRDPSSKGFLGEHVVRVQVSVAGGPPPDGVNPRYLKLRCGRSCIVEGEVRPLTHLLGLWLAEPDPNVFPRGSEGSTSERLAPPPPPAHDS